MEINNQQQLQKLIDRIESFIAEVKDTKSMPLRANIDPYFYTQKLEELKLLSDMIREASNRLDSLKCNLNTSHENVFNRWKRDVRQLNKLRPASPRMCHE